MQVSLPSDSTTKGLGLKDREITRHENSPIISPGQGIKDNQGKKLTFAANINQMMTQDKNGEEEEIFRAKGKDMDEESTFQNFMNVTRHGDLSPRHMENGKSVNTKRAFERIITIHRQYHFQFIGLMEPMQQARKLERYRRWIDFAQAMVNVSNKIWASFDEKCDVTVLFDIEQQLTMKLFDTEENKEFILTLVYAKCDHIARIELWDTLYSLANDMSIPWLVGGDFNIIWDEEEKFGGLPVSLNEVDDFRHCINTCNLFDLGFKGSTYIWWNGRAEEDCIFKRLDKCLANLECQQMWPCLEITHLSKSGSDHSPLLITCNPDVVPIKKSFRFLNFWIKHDTFQAVVKENWAADFQFCKQKSGMTWFNDGYKNTKFFHAQVNGRRKKLQLRRIQYNAGDWIEDNEALSTEAVNIFQQQFSEERVPTAFGILEHVPLMIGEEQNHDLIRQPTRDEVKEAVISLNGESVGGPDV
ncbi:uncharacterized protein [Nicotiana tomentosiformis]|uniref:uncharacterized protein n=1 Tax=Nicotiana tomentosiformis TaxID=4098 RepID=UPI00388C9B48